MVNKAKRSLMKSALSHLAGDLSSVRGPAEKGKIMRWREMQRQQAQLFQADIDTLGQNQAQVRFFYYKRFITKYFTKCNRIYIFN